MNEEKRMLRESILLGRRQLETQERVTKSRQISDRVVELLQQLENKGTFEQGCLFTYIPFGDEVDLQPVIEWCWRQGIPTAVPRTIRATRELSLHQITAMEQLEAGVWGIREPKPDTVFIKPDFVRVVLVPGTAFDLSGGRMGYGGGFYDRFFAQVDRLGSRIMKIAPAYDIQVVDEVPMEQHDTRMDFVITESRILRFCDEI